MHHLTEKLNILSKLYFYQKSELCGIKSYLLFEVLSLELEMFLPLVYCHVDDTLFQLCSVATVAVENTQLVLSHF